MGQEQNLPQTSLNPVPKETLVEGKGAWTPDPEIRDGGFKMLNMWPVVIHNRKLLWCLICRVSDDKGSPHLFLKNLTRDSLAVHWLILCAST